MCAHSKGAMASRPIARDGHSRTGSPAHTPPRSPFNGKGQEQVSAGTQEIEDIWNKI